MVNLTKRMHKLMPQLWRVKGGAGAAILPHQPPLPQLTSLTLRLPSPANGYDHGARSFWRNFLPSLKYHNLTLPIIVQQIKSTTADVAPTLTLEFQATTKQALENQNTQPRYTDQESLKMWQDQQVEEQRTQIQTGTSRKPVAVSPTSPTSFVQQLKKQQLEIGVPEKYATTAGEITIKPQAPADPTAPSTTSPPATLYQRTVVLGLRGRQALDIWRWFQGVTLARPYKLNKDERAMKRSYKEFEVSAQQDRERVKVGIDAMRREKEELKKAQEAASRLTET